MSDGLSFGLTVATPIGMMAWLGYVVFVHSKRRWPGTTALERYVHIMSFDGDWMRRHDRPGNDGRIEP